MAGYSPNPLVKKLGIKAGHRLAVLDAPPHYDALVAPLPPGVVHGAVEEGDLDVIHLFVTERDRLEEALPPLMRAIVPNGMIWISWPKRASKVPTTVTEDVIRAVALPLHLVDIKVCAVDAVWSALKLVIRKEWRGRTE